ncbi:MAG: sulfite dehydrogenase [Gemmatimonadota bacterium]|nr:sulfite dehydrogenase [Gemmatimonadota bacterium]
MSDRSAHMHLAGGEGQGDTLSRRDLLAGAAGASGVAVAAGLPLVAGGPGPKAAAPVAPVVPPDATKLPGAPTSQVGARSTFFKPSRTPFGETVGNSLTPLQDLTGTITPADLHFERHHAGIPLIDPARHTLLIHGLVATPLMLSVDDVKRFPQVTRTHFIECSGNGRAAYREPKPEMTPQKVAGLVSNTEWTGVPLKVLLDEAGAKPAATWFLAEGGDACIMTRSIPMPKAMDDALLVWAQNGEPLRPEQGFPLRLLLPGWEGNVSVKWLRRLELGTRPWATRWETSKYTDPLPDGTARQYSFDMDAKSVITSPAHPKVLAKGWWPVTGLAWTGRGNITRVEVSTDDGSSWHDAELSPTTGRKAPVRFTHMWEWDGKPAVLLSRATDETGYVQPTRKQLLKVRGIGTDFHFNPIVGWKVAADGTVTFHGET